MSQRLKIFLFALMALAFLPSCFNRMDLKSKTLNTALLDEYYEYFFVIQHGWSDFWDNSHSTQFMEGSLPMGVGIASNGALFGTPTNLGEFDFRVVVYDIDRYFDDIGYYSYSDAEWFFLFVTESSTNENCPLPNNQSFSEIYICLGEVSVENLSEGESFTLDVNFYVNLNESSSYNIDTLSFFIAYDEESFTLDADTLNSSRLREAATLADAEVSFDASIPGELGVVLTAVGQPFLRSGRILDLPFNASVDLNQETYDFNLTIDEISAVDIEEDTELPEVIALEGKLTLTDLSAEEEEATE